MKKEEIHLGDISRWLVGNTTPWFMVEVIIRTVLIYLILLLTVRFMGKRMTSQLTINELAVMITLGAIVSPAMQLPDRGLMFGVTGLAVAYIFQRGLSLWAFKNKNIEHLSQGKAILIIKNGTLNLNELKRTLITKQQVYALLREMDIYNLGSVKRAYMEASGTLSVFEEKENKPGLSIFPPDDVIARDNETAAPDHNMACRNCGHVQQIKDQTTPCNFCHAQEWITAFVVK